MPKKVIIDREQLHDLYINQRKTYSEIAMILNISYRTVFNNIKEFGINSRDTNNERSLLFKLNMSEGEFSQKLRVEYIDEQLSQNELGVKYGVSHIIIKKYLIKFGITLRNHKEANKISNTGSKNHKWNEGSRYHSAGYKQLYMPNHPNAIEGRYVYEHRYLMEQKIGRYLESHEHVHHINGNKADNRLKNLQLTNSSEHPKIEAEQRKKNREKNQLKIDFKDIV